MAQHGDIVICPQCGKEGELSIQHEVLGRDLVIHRQHLVTRDPMFDGGELSYWSAGRSPGEICGIDAETARRLIGR